MRNKSNSNVDNKTKFTSNRMEYEREYYIIKNPRTKAKRI